MRISEVEKAGIFSLAKRLGCTNSEAVRHAIKLMLETTKKKAA